MMDPQVIENAVVDILCDVLGEPPGALLGNPELARYEWDSVSSLDALAQIERRFAVTLDLRAYNGIRSVQDLVDLVLGTVAAPAGAQPSFPPV